MTAPDSDPTPAIRERLAAATDGPWAPWLDQDGMPHMNGLLMVGNADAVIPDGESWVEGVDVNPIAHTYTPEDREFIARAPSDIEWLLGEVERLREQYEQQFASLVTATNSAMKFHDERDRLRAAVDAVQALHSPGTTVGLVTGEEIAICRGCGAGPHPCRTVHALTTHLPDDTKETDS